MSSQTVVPLSAPKDVIRISSWQQLESVTRSHDSTQALHILLEFSKNISENLQKTEQILDGRRAYVSVAVTQCQITDDDCTSLISFFGQKHAIIYALNCSFTDVNDRQLLDMVFTDSFLQLLRLDLSFTNISAQFFNALI